MSSLVGGLLHPLAVPAHAVALLALGLLIGQQRAGRRRAPLLAFIAGLGAGLVAITFAVEATSAADVLLAAAAVTGLLVALARPMPALACAPLAVVTGTALGLDSPPEVIAISAATVMLIGTGLGACLALAVIAVCTSRLTREWQRIGVRILGSWLAASAILVLALRFARGLMFE
jgi:hydrogenase/urease accessory protein HupE